MRGYKPVAEDSEDDDYWNVRVVEGIVAIVLAVGIIAVLLLEYLSTFVGLTVKYTVPPPDFLIKSNILLCLGTGFLALHLTIGAVWGSEIKAELRQRHRIIRWIGHAFYMTFYIASLGLLLPFKDPVSLFAVSGIAAVALAYMQSYNEAVAKRTGDKVVQTAFNKGEDQLDGWVIALFVFLGAVLVFILYGAIYGATNYWIPIVAAGLYAILHFIILAITNFRAKNATGRFHEYVILVWEVVFALFLHIAIYVALYGVVTSV